MGNSGSEDAYAGQVANLVAIRLIDEVLNATHFATASGNSPMTTLHTVNRMEEGDVRRTSSQDCKDAEQQRLPLDAYTGQYCNKGYRCMMVEIRKGALFINATNRSEAFTLTFEHVCNQTSYVAHYTDYWEGGDEEIEAKFELSNMEAERMGIMLEDELVDYIWLQRVPFFTDQQLYLSKGAIATSAVR